MRVEPSALLSVRPRPSESRTRPRPPPSSKTRSECPRSPSSNKGGEPSAGKRTVPGGSDQRREPAATFSAPPEPSTATKIRVPESSFTGGADNWTSSDLVHTTLPLSAESATSALLPLVSRRQATTTPVFASANGQGIAAHGV
jgi:hypothetical protein